MNKLRSLGARVWRAVENLLFVGFAASILYVTVSSFFNGTWESLRGMGFLQDITDPVHKKVYYQSILAILSILTTFFMLVEIARMLVAYHPFRHFSGTLERWKKETASLGLAEKWRFYGRQISQAAVVREFFRRYKTNFLAKVFNEYVSKLFIIFVYIEWMPYFQPYALFKVPGTWWGWLYAYLMWELTYWIWHYLGHRVRLFWCLHAPHHAPVEFNLTVAWVHFFAEGYYTAAIQVPLLMLLGVSPEMVGIILVIDGTWGTFIHVGENGFKNGKLGILEKILITPSHHRIHHARNPLYMDTNFCVLLPFWDWLFGTLQTEKDEVKIEYGTTRANDPTSFIDMYFGECIWLYRDLKQTRGLKNKIKLMFMPPGWTPESDEQTARVVRAKFLEGREYLGKTSRDKLFK